MEPATAGALLRQARKRASLSQVDLAAGTRVDLIPAADLKPGVRERAGSDLLAL